MDTKSAFAQAVRIAFEQDYCDDIIWDFFNGDYDAFRAAFKKFFGETL